MRLCALMLLVVLLVGEALGTVEVTVTGEAGTEVYYSMSSDKSSPNYSFTIPGGGQWGPQATTWYGRYLFASPYTCSNSPVQGPIPDSGTWSGSISCTGVQYTNNWACLTVTNRMYLTGQRWVISVNYGGGTNQVVGPVNLPYLGTIPICVTNRDSFTIVACGERPDYDTPECYSVDSSPVEDPDEWDDGLDTDPTPDPSPGNQSTNNDTANIVQAIKEAANKIVSAVKSNAISINQGLVNLGGGGFGLTNVASESTLSGLSNSLMSQLVGPYKEMTNWIAATGGTNGWTGASNAVLAEAAYISNAWVSALGSRLGSQGYALTNIATVSQEDRDIWKMPVRTNVNSTAVSYIDLNPLNGPAGPLFSWVRFGIKFFIQLVVFMYMVNRFQNEFIAIIRIPGSGLGKQSIWATFVLWLKSNMVMATVLLGMVTFIGGQLDSFFVSMGGWYASPFSSTIVNDLGTSAKYLKAGIEVVEAMFPLSYLGIAIGTVFAFDMALSGSVVFFGRLVRALTE